MTNTSYGEALSAINNAMGALNALPPSRELSLAQIKLDEALMWVTRYRPPVTVESLATLQSRTGKPVRMNFMEAMREAERGQSVRRENWIGFDAMRVASRDLFGDAHTLVRNGMTEPYEPTSADRAANDWMFVTDDDLAHPQA